ncbi:hypothetical protein PB2503_06492 [Parvularcula bermudensis HTCC2503]|uniref:Lytic murein transglycosylase n=2 Tax=Parvularcula TaxID=208215 RepID=E0TI25_PARBH|nr:hypothetical protein PB2503_06492 [Parvularcula bermudensis HTCC2503]
MISFATALLATILTGNAAAAGSAAQSTENFDDFRSEFRQEAIGQGIDPAVYDREMRAATPLAVVLERNSNQPEFSRPIWAYLDSAVSDTRIANGIAATQRQAAQLDAIEAEYGVDKEIIGAIWGLESSYGAILGDYDIISATATLAYQGRRQSYGRSQLIGALKILQNGYADRSQLKGSWAGAMGQTQFIPTTYLSYAVDEDGDGKRDLWGSYGDVFASTANYLSRSGYEVNAPWGFEVRLPQDFDYATANLQTKRSVGEWLSRGVEAPAARLGKTVDLNTTASIIVPAGAAGPAFMVFDNFRAIMRYNNSTAYALGIGLLSDAIAGRQSALSTQWPRDDRSLSLTERKSLQQTLKERGYDPGPVDGIIGAGTKAALRAWQRDQGLPADGYASARTLSVLSMN